MAQNIENKLSNENKVEGILKVGRHLREIQRRGASSGISGDRQDNQNNQGNSNSNHQNPFYSKFRRGAGAFLLGVSLIGGGLGLISTNKGYCQEVNEQKIEDSVTSNLTQEYDHQEIWNNRIDDDVYKGNVAFTSYIGSGTSRQTELFAGKMDDDGNVKDIKRLTHTQECEIGPIFTDTLRIDYGRAKSTLIKDMELDKWFRINKDGTNIQPIDFMTWLGEYSRNHR
ncbi:hypothetical protein J4433_01725 [Candidatus Pacearchaeota archaeon]|nr:hypothetical protein [Candidatus Pacearchaeota archaeon]